MLTLFLALAGFSLGHMQGGVSDWPTYNGSLAGDRYCPEKEITAANVSNLRRVAAFRSGQQVSFESGLVVAEGTMFFTTFKHTYAIDAVTGKLKWKDVAATKQYGIGNNHGVAYADGMVFRGYGDGKVAAFEASTGHKVWIKQIARPGAGESMPIAPVAWDGKVFIGNAGGDNRGVTGRIYALDQKTGDQVWQFDTVPKTGPAADTWKNKSLAPAGGATWSSYSIDGEQGILYASVGNAAPDFDLSLRPGQNLYTDCVIALDAKTGKLLAYVQPTRNDEHDWDMAAAPALIRTRGGKSLAVAGGKDGILYGIDNRAASSGDGSVMPILYRTPVTRRINVNVRLSRTKAVRFAPGPQGGLEWNGPSFDPRTNCVFTPATDWPSTVKLASKKKILAVRNGTGWSGAHDSGFGKMDKVWGGYLTAVDADTGEVRWRYKSTSPIVAGVTSTGGGLVFCADAVGTIRAFNARNGSLLWTEKTGRACGGGLISYSVNGRQYVAVASGLISPIWPTKKLDAQVSIYRLP